MKEKFCILIQIPLRVVPGDQWGSIDSGNDLVFDNQQTVTCINDDRVYWSVQTSPEPQWLTHSPLGDVNAILDK